MTIKELEQRLGMSRSNIRFYEQEGLLSPTRSSNGYRDYSDADADTLEKIKLLRHLQLDLDTIRALQAGDCTLTDALSDQLEQLDTDQAALEGARSVCQRLRDTAVSFQSLNAAPYLRELGQLPDSSRFGAPADELPAPPGHPFRRWFARGVDLALCANLYSAFRRFVLHIPIPAQVSTVTATSPLGEDLVQLLPWNVARDFFTPESLLSTFVPFLLMLLIEPVLLHYWGTTPGKFLFGMKLRDSEGEKLSLSDAFSRTLQVIFWGRGLNIPYFTLWRVYRSYYTVVDRKDRNRWEYLRSTGRPEQYIIPEGKLYCVPYALILLVPVVWNLATFASGKLPPNRYIDFPWQNLLSEEEFEENYQHYLDRYYSEWAAEPQEYTGEWTPIYAGGNTSHMIHGETDKNGNYVQVTTDTVAPDAFRYTLRAPASYFKEQHHYKVPTVVGFLAYAGAMPGEDILSFRPDRMGESLFAQMPNFSYVYPLSDEGNWNGSRVPYLRDNKLWLSQTVKWEATGEKVEFLSDIEDTEEWLILEFTVSKNARVQSR